MISNMSMPQHFTDWNIHDYTVLAPTSSNRLWAGKTYDDHGELPVVFKELTTPESQADEGPGAHLLEYYGGHGAIKIYKHDESAQLLECADDHSLLYHLDHDKIDDNDAARIIAEVLGKLHEARPEAEIPAVLVPLRRRFNELYIKADSERALRKNDSIFIRAAEIADSLLATQTKEIPLHGDLHHENVVHSSGRGWLAIDPKGLIGDPAYDLSNVFANPYNRPSIVGAEGRIERLADIFEKSLGYDRTRLLQFGAVHSVLSACWSLLEKNDAWAAANVNVAGNILSVLGERAPEPIAA